MTETSDKFDFRWGVKQIDALYYQSAHVPGFILRNYHRCGVSAIQMMAITHISAFRFNNPGGKASPSLKTIAEYMGYKKDDSLRSHIADLEKKKLVVIERQPGKNSIYDFGNLTQMCLDYEKHTQAETVEGSNQAVEPKEPPVEGGPVPPVEGGPVPPVEGGPVPPVEGDEEIEDKKDKLKNRTIGTRAVPMRKKRIPAAQMNPMKDAIVLAFGWNPDAMNDDEWGQVQRAAHGLCKSGLSPEDVPSLHDYCTRQFTHFKPVALSGNVQEWRKSIANKVKRDEFSKPLDLTDEEILAAIPGAT